MGEREIRSLHQHGGVLGVLAEDGHADARLDVEREPVEQHRRLEPRQHLVGQRDGAIGGCGARARAGRTRRRRRAPRSEPSKPLARRRATSRSTSSPLASPSVLLIALNRSRSISSTATASPRRFARCSRARDLFVEEHPVRQAGQHVVPGEPVVLGTPDVAACVRLSPRSGRGSPIAAPARSPAAARSSACRGLTAAATGL